MAFRSDSDALLARAEALERANAELREKLASAEGDDEELEARNAKLTTELQELRTAADHQKAIERKEEKKAAAKRDRTSAQRDKRKQENRDNRSAHTLKSVWAKLGRAWVAVALAAVLLTFFVLNLVLGNSGGGSKPTIKEVYVVNDADGSGVISVLYEDQVWKNTSGSKRARNYLRLTAFDLATGKRRNTKTLLNAPDHNSRRYKVFRRSGHRLWAKHPSSGLQLLDLRQSSVLLNKGSLTKQLPKLGEYKVSRTTISHYSPPTPAVAIIRRDGRRAWVDMTPAVLDSPPPTAPWKPGYYCNAGRKASCQRTHCFGFIGMPKTSGLQLASFGQYPSRIKTPAIPAGPDPSPLLRPGFVKKLETNCALEVNGSVILLHDSAATGDKTTLLSMVSSAGQIVWTVPMAKMTKRPSATSLGGFIRGDHVYVLFSDKRHTLDLVQLSLDGKVIKQHTLL